jgi:hypothetical protein
VPASAEVAIGIAARIGHPITFWQFTRYGIVVTVLSTTLAWAYVWLRYFLWQQRRDFAVRPAGRPKLRGIPGHDNLTTRAGRWQARRGPIGSHGPGSRAWVTAAARLARTASRSASSRICRLNAVVTASAS